MRNFAKKIITCLLALLLFTGCFQPMASAEQLTDLQLNAIAMLNYITVLSREITSADNNRLYLEKAYSSVVNNLYPNSIDADSLIQLQGMLDILEDCRMLSVKRDRIEYLYEQGKAAAIFAAIPNPLDFLSLVEEGSKLGKMSLLADVAMNSAANYLNARTQAESEYIQSGWELDDTEAGLIHECRSNLFTYMVSMANAYDIPGYMTLTEKSVQDFVDWKNNDNTIAKIQFFESNKDIYSTFGTYWLALAECYYKNGDFKKCLEAIEAYRGLNIQIFRKDYDLANILPMAIVSLRSIPESSETNGAVEAYAQLLIDNTDYDNWSLRFFVAQTYINLYDQTRDKQYLEKAYSIELDNVNWLVNEQRNINELYLAPVKEKEIATGASNKERDQINQYNQMLREKRKKEFPEIYEPLRLNVDMLLQLAKELDIDNSEAVRIDSILHPRGEKIFLNKIVDPLYWATEPVVDPVNTELIEFAGTAIRVPISYISEDATITVSVKERDDTEETLLKDWILADVKRDSETNINDIYAVYTSEEAKKHIWGPESTIIVTITPKAECNVSDIVSKYSAEETKQGILDYLKFWEGHKNEWYDYLKVWDNSVNFYYVGNT